LAGHRIGHFRSVVRLLFPEIERIAGTLTDFAKAKKPDKVLQELAGELSLSDIEPHGYSGFALFQRLVDHLYVPVYTAEERQRMEADHVPNRHAALHGVVIYRSFKNSLNTLIMTDYVFQVADVVRRSASQVMQ
jgi:hypothetical protein